MENLHMIAGLGNPGREYEWTRHNAGFLVVERLAKRWGADWRLDRGFDSRLAWGECGGRRALLVEPQTYMNLSGQAVAGLAGYYRVSPERLLVVVDDANLPLGGLRLRPEGSSGGHHGLESIEGRLGTRMYARQRVGIGGRADGRGAITGHVLGRFGEDELAVLERVLERAAEQVESWMRDGVGVAMNRYNGMVTDSEQESSE
jgi:peptidyl-tRNA hydrolase, PTH1 family